MSDDVLLPRPLARGDAVAVVAPCHVVVEDQLDLGLAALRAWGLAPIELPALRRRHGHLAGTDAERLADLQAAFDDSDLRAVWVARGGSGLGRIVEGLDWTSIAADPKPIIGFSDATTLLHAAWRRHRLVTIHGQFAGRLHRLHDHADAAAWLLDLVTGGVVSEAVLPHLDGAPAPEAIAGGRAEGRLVGGNLSVLAAGIGTPWQLDTEGAVLFLEEVGEAPYRIDRTLTHLRTAGLFDQVAGVVVGAFVSCDPPDTRPSATVDEVVTDHLVRLGVPVLTGLPVGHVDRHLALPHGARVRLDADAGTVTLLELTVI